MNYFQRVAKNTTTKFWVNNVTREQVSLGLEAGTTGCTQNPAYTWKMLTHETEKTYAMEELRKIMKIHSDDREVARELQRVLIKNISEKFMPLYESSHGKHGYVSIQSDPFEEHHWESIVEDGLKSAKLNPNIMVKVPATEQGLKAIEVLLEKDIPINATEVMVIDQFIALGEVYKKVSAKKTHAPVMYYSLITGIYNEWLRKKIAEEKIDIDCDVLYQAGAAIAKKVYAMNHDLGYNMGYISGGVRTPVDFYDLVGGDVCVTMNWEGAGSCTQLIEIDGMVESKLFNPIPHSTLDTLHNKLKDFRDAYWAGSIAPKDFEHNGAVQYFYKSFVDAWNNVLKLIQEERKNI